MTVALLSPLTTHNLFHTVEGWVAIGTIALALATGVLATAALVTARRTKRLAVETKGIAAETERLTDETKGLADLQRRALQAAVKPTLMPTPGVSASDHEIEVAGDRTRLALHVRNVGNGLALLQRTRLLRDEGERTPEYGGTMGVVVVPQGEKTSAVFNFITQEEQFQRFTSGAFWIEIDYTDAVEEQSETALFHVERVSYSGEWRVIRVQLRRKGEEEAYASTGYGAIR
jgi:hypothetical protein